MVSGFGLEIRQGEKIFLQGKNGCGKSSILKAIIKEGLSQDKVIFNEEEKEKLFEKFGIHLKEGRMELAKGLKISYVSQDNSHLKGTLKEYAAKLNIDETLFLALLRKLDFSREQFEKRIEDYSGGQKKKVLIAGSLCEQAHLYIWDEPLNFIDVFSRMQIEELIMKYMPTMILVEHDKTFTEHTADRIIRL